MVTKSILEIYALAICFVALLCLITALGIGVYDLIQIANPEFTLSAYEYERHQSNEAFRPTSVREFRGISPAIPVGPTEQSEEEQTRQREASYQTALRSEQRRAGQSLTMMAIVLVIDVLVFLPHWLLVRRRRPVSTSS